MKTGEVRTFRNLAHYPSLHGKEVEIVAVGVSGDDWISVKFKDLLQKCEEPFRMAVHSHELGPVVRVE